jgi:arylsulfatase A
VLDEPVSALDLLPTFASLAGAALPSGLVLDGTDFRPLLEGGALERPQPLFWVYYNAINEQRVALRDGPWKLLARLEGGGLPRYENITASVLPEVRRARLTDISLHRLDADLGESRDLSAAEPARREALTRRMEDIYRELTATMHVWPD